MVVEMNTFKGATLPNFTSTNTTQSVQDTIYYPETLFTAALEEKTKHGMLYTIHV